LTKLIIFLFTFIPVSYSAWLSYSVGFVVDSLITRRRISLAFCLQLV